MVALVIFGFLLSLTGVLGLMASFIESDEVSSKWDARLGLAFLVIGIFVFAFGLGSMQDKAFKLETKLNTPKIYYYEGFKVDIENVNLNEFTIIYDVESDTYTLVKKVGD